MIKTERPDQLITMMSDLNMQFLGHARREEMELMIGTAATESGLVTRVQIGGGPARGLLQVEPDTAFDVYLNYLRGRPDMIKSLMTTCFGIYVDWFPARICLPDLLEQWDDFCYLIARCVYLRRPEPIPTDREGQAAYYKQWFNTPAGKGSEEKYLEDYEAHGCQALVDDLLLARAGSQGKG